MSVEAIAWLLRGRRGPDGRGITPLPLDEIPSSRHVGPAVVRCVLEVICEHADENGERAFASERNIAAEAGCHRWDVQNALAVLIGPVLEESGRQRKSRLLRIARPLWTTGYVDGVSRPQSTGRVDGRVDGRMDGRMDGIPRPEPIPMPTNPPTPRDATRPSRRTRPEGGNKQHPDDPVAAVIHAAAINVCELRARNGYGPAGPRAITAVAGQITLALADVAARWIDDGYTADRIALALADRFAGTNKGAVPYSPGGAR